MTSLPRPTVDVTVSRDGATGYEKTRVSISRGGKSREIVGEGWNETEKTRKIVEQLIDSPLTAEDLPGGDDLPRAPLAGLADAADEALVRDLLIEWINEGA